MTTAQVDPIKIFVTKEDIDAGRRGLASDCPVALAAKKKFGCCAVSVYPRMNGLDEAWMLMVFGVCRITPEHRYVIPLEASTRITVYDAGCDMEPFEFALQEVEA